jgi:hypothetical protein
MTFLFLFLMFNGFPTQQKVINALGEYGGEYGGF